MNFVDVFDQCRNVAQAARGVPTPVLRAAYVMAVRDWAAQSHWLRMTIAGAAAASTSLYNLGSDPLLEVIGIQAMSAADVNDHTYPVKKGDPTTWNPDQPSTRPAFYTYVPEGQFSLYPTPDDAYALTVTAIVQPKDGVTQIPEAPLRKYSTCFEAGALAYLLALKDTPWINPAESVRQDRIYRSGIANAKAEVQRDFNTGSQRVRGRRIF